MIVKTINWLFFLFIFGNLIYVKSSFAYLDAGTGSMIIQLILGGVTGLAVILKLYWRNLKDFFKGKKSENTEEDNSADV